MTPSRQTRTRNTAKRLVGAGAVAAGLALAPLGVSAAFADVSAPSAPAQPSAPTAPSSPTGSTATASSAPQCQLFGPLEGVFAAFESGWNTQAGSHGAPTFGNQLPDIANDFANGTQCPPQAPSGGGGAPSLAPPSGGGGGSSEGPQCQLFDPLTNGIETFEQQWNAQAGSQGGPEFGGSGPFPDIAAQIAQGAQCAAPTASSGGAPSLPAPPSGGGGGGSSEGPQCKLFDPLTSAVESIEQGWNSQAGSHGAPTFGGSGPFPDIAAQIAQGAMCANPAATSPSNGGGNQTGGGGSSQSGNQGSGGTGAATSSSSSQSGGSGTLTSSSVSGSGGSGSLAYTGEPSWIPLAGVAALALAGLFALLAIGLRLVGRAATRS
jgi:hypothetical protein